MRITICLIILSSMLLGARPTEAAPAQPLRLFVAVRGNDAWTGRAATPGAANAGPFATLERARQEVRRLKAAGQLPAGAEVLVRGGTYQMAETFLLGAEDSGEDGRPIVYRAYPGEKPALVGGRILTGFRPHRGKVLACDLKALGMEKVAFRQLFFAGERQVLARTPNVDPKDPHGGTWAHIMAVEGAENRREFTYAAELDKAWAKPTEGEICVFPGYDWAWSIVPVAKVDHGEKRITAARNAAYPLKVGDRFFLQNLAEELDTPGEWYRDGATGTLYFWPPADIATGQVLAPTLGTIIEMRGAANITLQGFTIEACDGDAVVLTDSRNCVVAGSVIRNCGKWAVTITGGSKSGAFGNDITATGAGGISLNGGDRKTLIPAGNFATNNYIHHVAVFARTYNTAINCGGVGNVVSNNLIHDTPHAGLTLNGNENVVEYNVVHHTNLQSGDTGGIYFCSRDWTQRGNIIRYNIFHHVGGFGKSFGSKQWGKMEFSYPHFTWGIYLDDPTTGTEVYGNVLYQVPICGLHNHGGRDNTFDNNILVDCPALNAGMLSPNWNEWPPIIQRLRDAKQPGSPYLQKYPELANYGETAPEEMTGVRFRRNIIYYTREGTAWLRGERQGEWGENNQLLYQMNMRAQDFPRNEWDYNTIYAEPGLKLTIQLGLSPQPRKWLSWEEWRKLGGDAHSILADPLFVDAANHDYRLRPESPALKQGFKPIPFEKIGPYRHAQRASWPVVEAPGAAAHGDLVTFRYVDLPEYTLLPARAVAPRDGAGNFFAKLAAGQSVKVAYFGGGIHPGNGWRAGVLRWLRAQYPAAKIEEINADVTDACRGSGFSVFRFGREVMERKPDLVLVDFTSDDATTEPREIWRAVEGVVRQAWKTDPSVDILFLHAFRAGFEREYAEGKAPLTVSAYEKLAEHYGIPSIDMGYTVAAMAREGKLLFRKPEDPKAAEGKILFSNDGVRPTAAGDGVYTDAITRGLQALAANATARPHALKKAYRGDNLEAAKVVAITPAMLQGDWTALPDDDPMRRNFRRHFPSFYQTTTPGARLTFKFRGTSASILDVMGPDTGQAIVTVDGKVVGIRKQVDPWSYSHRLASLNVADNLPDGVHTVTVEMHPEAPDRTVAINAVRNQANFKPETFQGIALRFGGIRLVGDLVE